MFPCSLLVMVASSQGLFLNAISGGSKGGGGAGGAVDTVVCTTK